MDGTETGTGTDLREAEVPAMPIMVVEELPVVEVGRDRRAEVVADWREELGDIEVAFEVVAVVRVTGGDLIEDNVGVVPAWNDLDLSVVDALPSTLERMLSPLVALLASPD